MKCFIAGQEYQYINNAITDKVSRNSYFLLTKQIYGLDFEKWVHSEYWDNRFIPSILMQNDKAVSSVAVCINDISWHDQRKRYIQISTVMTLPEYRNKGLNRYLMNIVLSEWEHQCDAIYLLANDSVVNFYPKFGFELYREFQYSKSVKHLNGVYRKLDIANPDDWNLIIKKYMLGNPFSALSVDNRSQFVFHCMQSYSKDIYYLEKYDAVAIVQFEKDRMTCYDIFTDKDCQLQDILNTMATENTKIAFLGFTPILKENCIVAESKEQDTQLFVLKGKENIFKNNKLMFPMLSRA